MRYPSIKEHLKPYLIKARRKTTINHAFAAAVAPSDPYEERRVRAAMEVLGQDPDQSLTCVYCGQLAETWDHVFATVKNSHFSGYGHRLGNLIPCCRSCNSKKGNKSWVVYMRTLNGGANGNRQRENILAEYLQEFLVQDTPQAASEDHKRLDAIRAQIIDLFAEADAIAARIRETEDRTTIGNKDPGKA